MGILRHRRIRRQETVPNDDDLESIDDDDEEDDEEDKSSMTTSSTIALPLTSTKNPYNTATAVGQDIIKKVPSKYAEKEVC